MKSKKLFVSLPMKGRKSEDIIADQKAILEKVNEGLEPDEKFEMLNSCLSLEPVEVDFVINHTPVFWLSRSLHVLCQADAIAFGDGWQDTRGCKIEHMIAETYEIPIVRD